MGSVLISECSAKSKHEHTDRKPETPQPFLSSAGDEIQTADSSHMDPEESKTNLTSVYPLLGLVTNNQINKMNEVSPLLLKSCAI